jgi:hypothetical protein
VSEELTAIAGYPRFQLSMADGKDMLVIRGDTFEVWAADVQLAKQSVDPEVARFFSANETGLSAQDVTQARENVAKASPSAQVRSITPNCTKCGGTTHAKEITLKSGTKKTVYECNQDNGECLNNNGFKSTEWGFGSQKGRDS